MYAVYSELDIDANIYKTVKLSYVQKTKIELMCT